MICGGLFIKSIDGCLNIDDLKGMVVKYRRRYRWFEQRDGETGRKNLLEY